MLSRSPRPLGMSAAIIVAFMVLWLAGLFLHAMVVPWMPLWSGGLYDWRVWQQPAGYWGPRVATVDGIMFLLVFGVATCASLCGAIWSSLLATLQDDIVGYCLTHKAD